MGAYKRSGIYVDPKNVGLDYERTYFMQDVVWAVENVWTMNSNMRRYFINYATATMNGRGDRVLVELVLTDEEGGAVRNIWIDKVRSSVFSFRLRHYEQAIDHEIRQFVAVIEDSTVDIE